MRRNESFFIVAFALIVVGVLVVVASLPLQSPMTQHTASSSSASSVSTPSLPSINATTWQVVQKNVTLSDHESMTPCVVFFENGCASGHDFSTNGVKVELIIYEGYYFYAYNHTRQFDNQAPITSTVWFTNSTIYCVAPKLQEFSVCPIRP